MIICEKRLAKAQAFLGRLERLPIRPRIEGEPGLRLPKLRTQRPVAETRRRGQGREARSRGIPLP